MTLEADTVVTETPRTRTRAKKNKPAAPPVTDVSEFEERSPRRARVMDEPPAEDPPAEEEEVEGAGENEEQQDTPSEAPEETPEDSAPAAATPLNRPAIPPQTQPQPRPKKPRATKVAAAAAEEEELPQVPELRELRPATTQALKKLGTILGNKIPGAEHFEVWKRSDNGQLGYVGDYNAADLAQSQGMASFLNRYAKPQYGAGDYQIFGITSDGKRLDAGVVRILGTVEPTDSPSGGGRGEGGLGDMLMRQIERDSQRRDRELREIMDKKSDPTDPIEQLTKIHDFSEKLSGGSGKGDTVVAMVQAMGQQTSTMLQVMTQQQQKSEERMMQLMTILGRKEADPIMMTLLAKLLDDKTGSSAPMPPMAPPPDPMAQLQGIAAVLVALKPADNLTPILLEQMNRDRMSTADIIGLVNQLRGEKGTDDFKKSMDNFTGIMQAVSTMRQQTEPSAGSMWGDILGGALSNRELVGSVAGLIRAKSGQTQATARVVQNQAPPQQQQPQQIPADVQARAADVARRRLAIEERKLAEEEARLGLTTGAPPVAVAPTAVVTPPPATAAAPEKMQPPATPGLPPNIVEHINGFIIAQDDGALVEAMVEFLLYLSSIYEPWSGVGNRMLDAISTGDKNVALRDVRQLLGGLVKSNLLQSEVAEKTIAAIDAHFEELVTHVQQLAEARANEEQDDDAEDENEIEQPASDETNAPDSTVA